MVGVTLLCYKYSLLGLWRAVSSTSRSTNPLLTTRLTRKGYELRPLNEAPSLSEVKVPVTLSKALSACEYESEFVTHNLGRLLP